MQQNQTESGQAMIVQIRIRGCLSSQWSHWFQEFSIQPVGDGDTLLTGPAEDQAALFGLLRKVRDLGTPLISVNRIEDSTGAGPGSG